jgi:hypothetical protein
MPEQSLLPPPPLAAVVSYGVELNVTVLFAAIALAALVYAVIDWRRSGKPSFLLMFIAGGAMFIVEPMIDTVGGCWFPANSFVAFTAYGRPMPVWLCLTYFFYFGIGVGVVWRGMNRGLSRAQLWSFYCGAMVADVAEEILLLHFKVYLYYGPQPLEVLNFPLWWCAVNGLTTMAAAAVVYRYQAYLMSGWRQLQVIPVVLTVSTAVNCMVGWPSWMAINTPVSPVVTQIAGIGSFCLSLWFMSLVVKAVATQSVPHAERVTGGATERAVRF